MVHVYAHRYTNEDRTPYIHATVDGICVGEPQQDQLNVSDKELRELNPYRACVSMAMCARVNVFVCIGWQCLINILDA